MRDYLKTRLSQQSKDLILALIYAPFWLRDWLFCSWHRLQWDRGMRLRGLPRVYQRKFGGMRLGKRLCLVSSWRFNSLGIFQPTTLKTMRPGAMLEIGDDVGISGATISASRSIRIGNRVLIGSGVMITDSDAHPLEPGKRSGDALTQVAPVIVEDDVFIGARAIILKGVRIGRGSVIGAGSVVSKDIPAHVIAAGNPCKVIKSLGVSD